MRGKALGLGLVAAACVSGGTAPEAAPAGEAVPVLPDSVAAAREAMLGWLALWCPFDWWAPYGAYFGYDRTDPARAARGFFTVLAKGRSRLCQRLARQHRDHPAGAAQWRGRLRPLAGVRGTAGVWF